MVIKRALPQALLFLFALPIAHAAEKNRFAGCAGLSVTRTNDFSTVDVSKDLNRADHRIQQICGKVIPKKLKAIEANVQSCVAGANQEIGPGLANSMKQQVQNEMQAFQHRIIEACDSMKKTMKEAQSFCDDRKAKLDELTREISPIEKSASSQADSQQKAGDIYGKAHAKYLELSAQAKASEKKIYSYLPDKDESRAVQKRKGNESASTQDVKTDHLIEQWKSTLTLFAKENKNKSACDKLTAKGGTLDDMGKVLKNNLWPNGKMAARAIVRVEEADQAKAQEFAQKKAEADKLVAASGLQEIQDKREYERTSDISGTSGTEKAPEAKQGTQADLDGLKKKDEGAATCSKPEGCKTEQAVWAALHEANKDPTELMSPESAAASIHGSDSVGYMSPESAAANKGTASTTGYMSPESAAAALATPQQSNCTARVWAWSYLWKVDAPGVKNAAGECVPINP